MNSRQVEEQSGRSTGNPESPRLRFAKKELTRALTALETVDREQFDAAMRVLALEDQLADVRADVVRWRQGFEAVQSVLEQTGEARARALEDAIREWVGRA